MSIHTIRTLVLVGQVHMTMNSNATLVPRQTPRRITSILMSRQGQVAEFTRIRG